MQITSVLRILPTTKLRNLLILAVLLRVLIMPFYYHPDIKTYNYQVSHLKVGITNIYQFIAENRERLSIKDDFTYFPLTYFFLGTYQILITPLLGPNFSDWLVDSSSQSTEKLGVFRYLFLFKLLYLALDIIIAILLMKFFDTSKQKEEVFKIWLFNPFSTLLIYVYSGIDIIPVLFTLIGLLLYKYKKIISSIFTIGIAAAFKGYTLLFLPFLILIGRNTKSRILIALSLLTPFLIVILPFLFSKGFKEQALVSGLTNRIVSTSVNIGFGETLILTVVAVSALFFWVVINQRKLIEPWYYLLAVLLILFSTIHYHIQWLLWILPFLVYCAVSFTNLNKLIFTWLILAFTIPILYDDKSMTVSLFSAISPLYNLLPTPFQVVQKFYDPFAIQSIVHSIMFAISVILIGQLVRINKQ